MYEEELRAGTRARAVSELWIALAAWGVLIGALLVLGRLAARRRERREAVRRATIADPPDRRTGGDRRSGHDRRLGPADRRVGQPDPRTGATERRTGTLERRSGGDRRSGRDRRSVHPLPA